MAKALKLGGKIKSLAVEIGGSVHDVPLADYMPMAEAREMLRIKRLPARERDGAYTEFFMAYFEKFIGVEDFAGLSMKDFEVLMDAWNQANEDEGAAEPGE